MKRFVTTLITCFIALTVALPASAQDPTVHPSKPTAPPTGTPAQSGETMPVSVSVNHGTTNAGVPNVPVFLRAARPRGPFEPTAPPAQFEWSAFTDASGRADFAIPRTMTTSGLRLHAVTTYGGIAFESAASAPGAGLELALPVYDTGLDTSTIAFSNVRTVVDLWEGYLVFTQFYTLTNEGKLAIDIASLPGEEFEKGLPIQLPVKAQGINVTGPGESVVVNSIAYWKGVLEPGATKNLQIRFSMTADDSEFVYEQEMGYPTHNIEVVVPIQTRFAKIPRLDELELRPLGFPETDRGHGIFNLRSDLEFVGATGAKAEPGESFRFQLRGLPFTKPVTPWVFFGLGLLVGLGILGFARAEQRRAQSARGRQNAIEALNAEREEILDDLVSLEKDVDEGVVTAREHELESAALRERLALVMKKLEDLRSE